VSADLECCTPNRGAADLGPLYARHTGTGGFVGQAYLTFLSQHKLGLSQHNRMSRRWTLDWVSSRPQTQRRLERVRTDRIGREKVRAKSAQQSAIETARLIVSGTEYFEIKISTTEKVMEKGSEKRETKIPKFVDRE
jgi:hypothetical protein